MAGNRYQFGAFTLDADQRTLSREDGDGGRSVTLNSRYFDALLLLVRHPGELISKDRFNEQVWHAAPVTDEALTQCIRTLRRALQDKATDPAFIETVPGHGYRFVAEVREAGHDKLTTAASPDSETVYPVPISAMLGGAAAGILGGLVYGLIVLPDGSGGLSALLVLLMICAATGAVAGLGVGLGIRIAQRLAPSGPTWTIPGGALGGAAIGALVKLLGLDAFTLILGKGPDTIAGAGEGAVLGAVIGGTLYLAHRIPSRQPPLAFAALGGLAAGAFIAFTGGRLMAGSLDRLARSFEGTGYRLDRIGALFGEDGFGTLSLGFTTAFEAMLFAVCVSGAILFDPLRRKVGHDRHAMGGKARAQHL